MSGEKIPELRYSQIRSFKESGLSIPAWCKENQIKANTLRYWLKKIQVEETTKSNEENWVSISLNNPVVDTKVSPIVVKIGSFSVEIQPGFDRSTLTDIFTAIHGVC
jgi:hypothetical protein